LIEVTQKKLGMTCIVNEQNRLQGIFTDGDLRRSLDSNIDIHTTPIGELMTTDCKTISPGLLAVEALTLLEQYGITALAVTDDAKHLLGIVHMHDLLHAGVV
jgi:arabinose-5-phosphate isomerase